MTSEVAIIDQIKIPIEQVVYEATQDLLATARGWEETEHTPSSTREGTTVWYIEHFIENIHFINHLLDSSPSLHEFLLRTKTRIDLKVKFFGDSQNSYDDLLMISLDQFGLKLYRHGRGNAYPFRGAVLTNGVDLIINPQEIQTWLESVDRHSIDYLRDLIQRFARLSPADILDKIWEGIHI